MNIQENPKKYIYVWPHLVLIVMCKKEAKKTKEGNTTQKYKYLT